MDDALTGSLMMLLFAAFLWTIVFLMFREERKNTRRDMERYEEWLDRRYERRESESFGEKD